MQSNRSNSDVRLTCKFRVFWSRQRENANLEHESLPEFIDLGPIQGVYPPESKQCTLMR